MKLKGNRSSTDLRRVMTQRQRRTCTLAWSAGLPHYQIAESQGISLKAVSMRLYRARQRLRRAGIDPPSAAASSHRARMFQLNTLENV